MGRIEKRLEKVAEQVIEDAHTITLELNKPVTSKLSDWDKSEVELCQCDELANINDSLIGEETCIKCDKIIDRHN